MAEDNATDLKLEIAHILTIDVVAYSTLLIHEQSRVMAELNRVVRSAPRFRRAEAEGKLIRLPTGDGMALVFHGAPEAPIECAMQISTALKDQPAIRLRMGIHSGPVKQIVDVNDHSNVTGAGIDLAQRVMDCGDAGHILLSKRFADDLAPYSRWNRHLHDLGTCEIKHGRRLEVFNFYTEALGNPAWPRRFQADKRDQSGRKPLTKFYVAALVVLGLLLVAGWWTRQLRAPVGAEPGPLVKKSIAVLPFENRGEDKANAYFADGVQEEIMANLGKIADLKVVSRTSTMPYRNRGDRDPREIGRRLGVLHLLDGSVQRLGGKVRVNAQLIDTRTTETVWAQTYDRGVDDLFAMQSEIAKTIADHLKAKISPGEQTAIEKAPTTNFAAYDLYLQGKQILSNLSFDAQVNDALLRAIALLERAVARDPNFLLAYCQLAFAHDHLYFYGLDRSATRLSAAEAAIKAALRIQPDSGEAHLAAAGLRYRCHLDYDGARAELTLARRSLPNEPNILSLSAYIDRRRGRWDESTRNLILTLELDPQNLLVLQQLSLTYQLQRRFPEMSAILDRALESAPRDVQTRVTHALVSLEQRADPRSLRETINAVLTVNPSEAKGLADQWLFLALCERDFVAAARAIAAIEQTGITTEGITFPRAWCEGLRARAQGNAPAAQAAFSAARMEMEHKLSADPDYAPALSVLGLIDAALGRKSNAIAAGKRAVELLPLSKDAIKGAQMIEFLAVIYAWSGESDLAFEQLRAAVRLPGYLSYGRLQLHPFWDELRADPRFVPLVASLAPAEASP